MAIPGSFLVYRELGIFSDYGYRSQPKALVGRGTLRLLRVPLSSHALRQDAWSRLLLSSTGELKSAVSTKSNVFQCRCVLAPNASNLTPVLKSAAEALTRSYNALHGRPTMLQMVPAVGIIAFAVWGLGPLMRLSRIIFLRKSDSSWSRSSTNLVITSYVRPLLLWTGAILICRVLDPIILPTEASQSVKQRAVNFIRSLSTVLASAYCLSSLIQQSHKFFMELNDSNDTRTMGFQFATKAVYTAVWVAAVSLFMELLGFSTQKWVTAGGLGTVLLTLAGREIFTNFLSSVMIHATRPFVLNEWIQTTIGGMDVSGTVEHVGWWSPTVIRGDDREAIHIPNHKFTMSVVRNLTQKSHWRIKTHLAISHLDVNKINNIVADMRKVLGKNPQVEQQKLHRRVFLESINPENQALMILVSCFVKTSRFEEYLCVKEAIILDLLRVISHHRARLATPMRTIQKTYREPGIEDVPFGDTFSGSRPPRTRPTILVEASYKTQSGDEGKPPSTPPTSQTNEEKDAKGGSTPGLVDEMKAPSKVPPPATNSTDSSKSTREPKTSDGPVHDSLEKGKNMQPVDKPSPTPPQSSAAAPPSKQDGERPITPPPPPVSRPGFEDNIVLGVALDGSKRTLPIEEDEMTSSTANSAETKELAAAARNGSGSASVATDKKDDSAATRTEQREKGR